MGGWGLGSTAQGTGLLQPLDCLVGPLWTKTGVPQPQPPHNPFGLNGPGIPVTPAQYLGPEGS